MFLAILILAISVSIDSFGIGITYGIRNTTINKLSATTLFVLSMLFSSISIFLGNIIFSIIPENVVKFISIILLFGMGIWIILETIKNPIILDLNKSNTIALNEAFCLAIALSIDSICVGISCSSFGNYGLLYPILVPIFQLLFLNSGIILGKNFTKIHLFKHIPLKLWNILSGILIIAIGIFRAFVWEIGTRSKFPKLRKKDQI